MESNQIVAIFCLGLIGKSGKNQKFKSFSFNDNEYLMFNIKDKNIRFIQ